MKDLILSCDLETTSKNPSYGEWITGSFAVLDADSLVIQRELYLESRPRRWSYEAQEIHKIPRDVAAKFPADRKATLQKLIEFLPPPGTFTFLCHANTISKESSREYKEGQVYNSPSFVHFDFACLKMDFFDYLSIFEFRKYFNDRDVYSTWTMAHELMDRGQIPKEVGADLKELCIYFKIPLKNHHNAIDDRIACERLYAKLRSFYDDSSTKRSRDLKLDPGAPSVPRLEGSPDQQRFGL